MRYITGDIKFMFDKDECYGYMVYDYKTHLIKLNLLWIWNRARRNEDNCIKLFSETIHHEWIHLLILQESRKWALGEEMIVRLMGDETMSFSNIDYYRREYCIPKDDVKVYKTLKMR